MARGTWAFALVLAATFSASSAGADYREGYAAYLRRDYTTAVAAWTEAGEKGDMAAQFGLGLLYETGDGVAVDLEAAAHWYRLAAEQGDVRAQSNLGTILAKGEGIAPDYAEALRWLGLAAEQGDVSATHELASLYEQG
ncbi:tetratricopeptide repeat protein, partial [Phaeovulum sp.]|uniref:tetratricopeptide repeat protein n=1 Tax=Phaeovulum sp. TaxID=2934796 RepID=UPI00356375AA